MKKIEGKKTKPKRRTPIKVLLAKIGLDGHDRGIKVIAQALRDAGFEVIYLGIHNSPEEIVRAAIQEDPRAIGISIHSAAHMVLFKKVLLLLKKQHADEIKVFGGGIPSVASGTTTEHRQLNATFGRYAERQLNGASKLGSPALARTNSNAPESKSGIFVFKKTN